MTTHQDMVYQLGGVPVGTPHFHTGRAIFVRPYDGDDDKDGKTVAKAVKTLSAALALATVGNNDTVYLIAESNTASHTTAYQSVMLDWNKDGVHLVGVGAEPMIGSRARIGQLSTVVNIDTLFRVSANNCYIANIEFFQGVASNTSTVPTCVEVRGQRNHFVNCQISGNGDTAASMDVAGARSLVINGGVENIFQHCYIGLDTVSRGTQAAEIELKANGSLAATRNIFENCYISSMSGASGFYFVKADSAAGAIDRFVIFRKCIFINAVNSTATAMSYAMVAHASLGGSIVLDQPMIIGATAVSATSTKIYILGIIKGGSSQGLAETAP